MEQEQMNPNIEPNTEQGTEKTGVKKKGQKSRKPSKQLLLLPLILLLLTVAAFAAVMIYTDKSTADSSESVQGEQESPSIVLGPGAYDSADMAVLVDKNEKDKTLTFLNLDVERTYTLTMDGTTSFYDKYGGILALNQVQEGDIVDITFLKEQKHLTSLTLSSSAWKFTGVEQYEIDQEKNRISIGADVYRLTSNTLFFSGNNSIELMEINPTDVLSIQGIGKQVLSVTVEQGHGYLRLKNDTSFIGGWIEVGQSMICKITEDMLLAVPEGNHEITISHRGGGGNKKVVIYRDEETVLDIGDMEVPAPESGTILFSVSPADAELYIDGTLIDASLPVKLVYGLHQLIVRAEGYQSITRYIRVAQPSAGIDVVLDLVGSGEVSDESDGDEETTTDYYKVYVDAPVDAEVYLDGKYIGKAPCSFKKKEGTYVIILRKDGYETRSYTVNIDNSAKDLSYSFADLVKNP